MHLSPHHLRNTGVLVAHSRTWVSRGRQGYKSRSLCSLPLHIKPRAHWAISQQSVLEHKFLNSGSRKKISRRIFKGKEKRLPRHSISLSRTPKLNWSFWRSQLDDSQAARRTKLLTHPPQFEWISWILGWVLWQWGSILQRSRTVHLHIKEATNDVLHWGTLITNICVLTVLEAVSPRSRFGRCDF